MLQNSLTIHNLLNNWKEDQGLDFFPEYSLKVN